MEQVFKDYSKLGELFFLFSSKCVKMFEVLVKNLLKLYLGFEFYFSFEKFYNVPYLCRDVVRE